MAKKEGAETADAVVFDATSIEVSQRLGAPEKLERAESADMGLRVFIGKQQAIVSSTDHSDGALREMAERAVAMAKVAPEDPWCGIADPDQIAKTIAEMDSFDPIEPETQTLIDMATEAEDAARAVAGVTNSEGAEAGYSRARIAMAATNGFAQDYAVTSHSFSASVIAGEGTTMERDYDFAIRGLCRRPEDHPQKLDAAPANARSPASTRRRKRPRRSRLFMTGALLQACCGT